MAKEVKAATLTVTELVNATEVASIEQSNTNNMEKKEISENGNAANAASNELKSWGKDMGVKPTTVKARINGEVQTIIVAHTEYGMRHDKKMDKMLTTANRDKLLTPRYHFCKPDIFWKEGYNLFDNNGELIEQGTTNVLTHCETPETSERIYIDDFLEEYPNADWEAVTEHFGSSDDLAKSYMEQLSDAELAASYKTHHRHLFLTTVICCSALIALIISIYYFFSWWKNDALIVTETLTVYDGTEMWDEWESEWATEDEDAGAYYEVTK